MRLPPEPSGSVTTATGRVSWGTALILTEWKSSTRLAMSVTDQDWSKVRSAFTELIRSISEIGLESPRLATAEASTRRNSWSRRIRARSLSTSWGQYSASRVVVPGASYWRWRARTTWRAWVPLRWTQVAAWTFRPDSPSKTDSGKAMLIPPRSSTTLANWSKLSDTACWIGMPKSSSTAPTTWLMPW